MKFYGKAQEAENIDAEYLTLTELGSFYGCSNRTIGQKLKEIGLREPDGTPTLEALYENYVEEREHHERPWIKFTVWKRDLTIAALDNTGMERLN